MLAYSLIVTEPGCVQSVLDVLIAMPEVQTASPTGGPYDVVVTVMTASARELQRLIERLSAMTEVRSVTTLVTTSSLPEYAPL